MKITLRRSLGLLTAAAAIAAGLFAAASPASASDTKSIITPVFPIEGVYSDGGSARPRITRSGNLLSIDMSSQNRPTANGMLLGPDSIMVTFRDDTTYYGQLIAPRTIRWSNGSSWVKAAVVPTVRGMHVDQAISAVRNAGFRAAITSQSDRSCEFIDRVMSQTPHGGSYETPGATITLKIGMRPPTPCP